MWDLSRRASFVENEVRFTASIRHEVIWEATDILMGTFILFAVIKGVGVPIVTVVTGGTAILFFLHDLKHANPILTGVHGAA